MSPISSPHGLAITVELWVLLRNGYGGRIKCFTATDPDL
jgi:hypothetical protein